MILPGCTVAAQKIVRGLLSEKSQIQPCGVDLSLKRVLRWTSAGVVDFDNTHRPPSATGEIPFLQDHLHLESGAYLVEFNETVDTPLDVIGQLFVRSSLFRSGAVLSAGVMDAGYAGAVGAMLQVCNPHGIILYRNAKLAQFVFHEMTGKVEGYSGIYQGSKAV